MPAGGARSLESAGGSATYLIQLNAFKVEQNATRFFDRIRQQGYPAVLEHEEGERWYKVKVGPFADWAKAKSVSEQLEKAEKLSPLILIRFAGEGDASDRIMSEDTGPPEATGELPPQKTESEGAAGANPSPAEDEPGPDALDRVIARFLAWKEAWQEKDLETYLGFYSGQFDPAPRTRQAWERSRKRALDREGTIQVQVGEMEVAPVGDRVEMRFIQKFQSSTFQDVGLKTLVWGYENGQWKILSERWLPI